MDFEKANVGYSGGVMQARSASDYATEAPSNSALAQALSEQEKLLAAVQQEVSELDHRLSGFLRPEPPSGAQQGAATPRSTASPIAELITRNNQQLLLAVHRLRGLSARIDA